MEKNNPNVYNRLGHIYMARLGLLEKGFEYFKTANKVAPGLYISKRNLLLTAISVPDYQSSWSSILLIKQLSIII